MNDHTMQHFENHVITFKSFSCCISDRTETLDQDEEYIKLQEEYAVLMLEEEELIYIGKNHIIFL